MRRVAFCLAALLVAGPACTPGTLASGGVDVGAEADAARPTEDSAVSTGDGEAPRGGDASRPEFDGGFVRDMGGPQRDADEPDAYVPTPPTFACVPGGEPSASPLRRLTRLQYTHTLRDLAAWALSDAVAADAVMAGVEVSLAQIPADDTRLEGAGQDISQAHVEGQLETAQGVAEALTRDAAVISTLVGGCATDAVPANDGPCITAFIERFGRRALRRPLAPEEVAFYRDEVFASATIQPTPLRELVTVLLMAPEAVFHVETGGTAVEGRDDLHALDAYALAARLSYHFWQSMPDEALLAAAEDGSLLTDAGYVAQVERVFADPRTAETLDLFFAQWLELDRIPQPADEVGTEPFDTFAGDDRPSPALPRRMAQEVVDLVRHYVWSVDGALDDLFTSDLSFATTPDLAAIYDVPVWDGASPPPRFPAGERIGLLTRAALLVSGTWHTLPIHKGVVARRRILCDSLGRPPEGAQNQTVQLEAPYTQRTYAEQLTMREGTQCALCHEVLNPIGFSTEGYDALGRKRDQEFTWDEATGRTAWLPVNTASIPRADELDPRPAADALDATRFMLESGKPHACVSRFYFRFTFGRLEDLSEDGCVLESLRAGLRAGRPLRQVLRDVALAPEFKLRRVGPEAAPPGQAPLEEDEDGAP